MNDEQLCTMLRIIRSLALMEYPYSILGTPNDPGLILRLGEIAGIADKALREYRACGAGPGGNRDLTDQVTLR
jgi:hypothetical protein